MAGNQPVDPSVPYQRTRRDHAAETAEDYVEAIAGVIAEHECCRVRDLVKHFGVSHVTVSRTIARLSDLGLVKTEAYRPIELTSKGRRLANQSRERHEIVFKFLRAIGVDAKTAAKDAEGIEHHVSPTTLDCMSELLKDYSMP